MDLNQLLFAARRTDDGDLRFVWIRRRTQRLRRAETKTESLNRTSSIEALSARTLSRSLFFFITVIPAYRWHSPCLRVVSPQPHFVAVVVFAASFPSLSLSLLSSCHSLFPSPSPSLSLISLYSIFSFICLARSLSLPISLLSSCRPDRHRLPASDRC